jgi:hypothetical protein
LRKAVEPSRAGVTAVALGLIEPVTIGSTPGSAAPAETTEAGASRPEAGDQADGAKPRA